MNVQLSDAYERWQAQPFPPGSELDELDELHAELGYADAMLAECAIPFVTEGRYTPMPTQALQELDHVIERSRVLESDAVPETARTAAAYRVYAELLKAVCDGVEDAHNGSDQ